MVAITVILAAVIGAFVLEIGDQQESAPTTSFTAEEQFAFFEDSGGQKRNVSTVTFTAGGGDTIDVTQADVAVEGNRSVWGPDSFSDVGSGSSFVVHPTPNIQPTLGNNDPVEITAGENLNVLYRGGSFESYPNWACNPPVSDNNVGAGTYEASVPGWLGAGIVFMADNTAKSGGSWCDVRYTVSKDHVLHQGDTVNVIWTSESGGKSQTLFEYTVQQEPSFKK
jgi:hypothetical protein